MISIAAYPVREGLLIII